VHTRKISSLHTDLISAQDLNQIITIYKFIKGCN